MPSSVVVAGTAARPLDCSRRSPNDLLGRHPASSGRAGHACAAAGVDGQAARVCREVGERPLSSTPTESVVARVALGGPSASLPTPSPRHLLPRIAQSPSTTLRTADGSGVRARTRERGALVQRSVPSRPACRPAPPRGASSPRLLRPGGRVALESVAIRWVCPVGSPVRRPLSSILGVGRSRLGRGRPLAFGSVGPAIPSCTEDSVDSAMPRSLEFGIKNVDTFSAPHLGGPYKVRRATRSG